MSKLDNSDRLNPRLSSDSPVIEAVAEEAWARACPHLRGRRHLDDKRTFSKLLAVNLVEVSHAGRGQALSYYRRKGNYAPRLRLGRPFLRHGVVVPVVDAWERAGIIKQYLGYRFAGKQGRVTRAVLTEAGHRLFGEECLWQPTFEELLPSDLVEVRPPKRRGDGGGDEEEPYAGGSCYEDDEWTAESRRFLLRYNRFIGDAQVCWRVPLSVLAESDAQRSLREGALRHLRRRQVLARAVRGVAGRGRDDGGGAPTSWRFDGIVEWLGRRVGRPERIAVPVDARLRRIFNEESRPGGGTRKAGGRFYASYQWMFTERQRSYLTVDGGPTVELDFRGMLPRLALHFLGEEAPEDPYGLYDDPGAREVVKKAVVVCLNARSRPEAVAALGKAIRLDQTRGLRDSLAAAGVGTAAALIDDIPRRLPGIQPLFYAREGLLLQRCESEIAFRILRRMSDGGVPCLALHDGFIVPVEYGHKLEAAMQESFRLHNDGNWCPITWSTRQL
ncbi:MAG: hypothetical protein ACE149_15820 [Armatimonadota bacterium]